MDRQHTSPCIENIFLGNVFVWGVFMYIMEGAKKPQDKNREFMLQRDYIADAMEEMSMYSPQSVQRTRECCSYELFTWNPVVGRRNNIKLNRCRNRCCPICQHLDHANRSGWLRYADEKLHAEAEEKQHKKISPQVWYNRYKFITFSPFVSMPLEEVAGALRFGKGVIGDLCRIKNWNMLEGSSGRWLTCEVTYNQLTGLYHPHFHLLLYYDHKAPFIDNDRKKRIHDYFLRKVNESRWSRSNLVSSYPEAYVNTKYAGDPKDQETVSIDYKAVRVKQVGDSVSPEFTFELTKYVTKVTSFVSALDDDEHNFAGAHEYLKLMKSLADGGVRRMQGSGVLAYKKAEYKAFIQNANCAQNAALSNDNVVFLFRGGLFDRRKYILSTVEGDRLKEWYEYQQRVKFNKHAIPPEWAYREVELDDGRVDIVFKNDRLKTSYSIFGSEEDILKRSYYGRGQPIKIQESFICPWSIQSQVDVPLDQVCMFSLVS